MSSSAAIALPSATAFDATIAVRFFLLPLGSSYELSARQP